MEKKWGEFLKSIVGLTIGAFIMSFALQNFLDPNSIAPGGITGFGIALKTLTGIPVYVTNLAINIPLFAIGILVLGASFGWKTFYATGFVSVFLKLLPVTVVTKDPFLAAVFGGLILGFGIGTVIRSGGTTGGSDTIGAILNKFLPFITIPTFMVMIDTLIISFAGYADKNIDTALYSMVSMFVMSMTIRRLINDKKKYLRVEVKSSKKEMLGMLEKEDLRDLKIQTFQKLHTQDTEDVVLFIIERSQYPKVIDRIREVDKKAYVEVGELFEVLGESLE